MSETWVHNKDCRKILYPERDFQCNCGADRISTLEKQLSERDAALARCVDFLDALARHDSAVFKEDISGAMRQAIKNLLETVSIRALKANPSHAADESQNGG